MQNSVRIESYPIPIRFAGWESDTYRLQRCGWQISAYDTFNFRGQNDVQLILRHEGLKLHAITNCVSISPYVMEFSRYSFGSEDGYLKHLMQIGLEVKAMGTDVVLYHHFRNDSYAFNGKDFASNFKPIDAVPNILQEERIDLKSLKIFKPISTSAPEIVIPTNSVDEMMNLVLKLQDPVQAEIRERRRKEKMREDWRNGGYDSAADIKCQILAFG